MTDLTSDRLTRRRFLLAATALPLALTGACGITEPPEPEPARLRLQARRPVRNTLTGTDVLYGDGLRRAYLRVPPAYDPAKPTPLIIGLHGSGGRGDTFLNAFASRMDAHGFIMLAPDSLTITWDAIETEFAGDVVFINDVVNQTFERCNVDASRIALLGFSDGATYALSLGLSNGDQLRGVIAHSPGFYMLDHPHGTPAFFVSHGTNDEVLPIDMSSRVIVPELRARGSAVAYVEFDGGHTVTGDIADQALAWLEQRFAG